MATKYSNLVLNTINSAPTSFLFNSPNAQSDGTNTLKRIEFEFQGKQYPFVLNPEEYTQEEPSRGTVTQTKGAAWLDDFGMGIPIIDIKGTTGFKNGSNSGTSGFVHFKSLRDVVRTFYASVPLGQAIPQSSELIFHNYTDGEHWIVYPVLFNLFKSIARPLLYMYEIQMQCLRAASVPSAVVLYNNASGASGAIGKISSYGNLNP